MKNLDGSLYSDKDDFIDILANHIISPIRFDKEIELMKNEGIDLYIEIGPGKTLTGFIKKQNPDANVMSVSTVEDINNLISKSKEW